MTPKETFERRIGTGRIGEVSWTDAGHPVREQIHYICEPERQSGHLMEMSFLRHLMLYDETDEHHQLEEKITHAESRVRSARRAVWLMALLTGLALVGLGYSAVLLEDFPRNRSQFLIRIFCALGLASLVSLLAFIGCWILACGELEHQRDGCRRLVTRIMESRLGKPGVVTAANSGVKTLASTAG